MSVMRIPKSSVWVLQFASVVPEPASTRLLAGRCDDWIGPCAEPATPLKEKACLNSRLERSWWRRRGSNPRPPHCERGALLRSQPLDLASPLVSCPSQPVPHFQQSPPIWVHQMGTHSVQLRESCCAGVSLASSRRKAWGMGAHGPQKTNGQARCLAQLMMLSIRFWIMLCLPKKTRAVRGQMPLALPAISLPLVSITHRNWENFPEEVFELSHVSALNHGRSEQDDKEDRLRKLNKPGALEGRAVGNFCASDASRE